MKPSLRLLCQLSLISAFVTPLQAAEEFQGAVPQDLVKALLGGNNPYDIRFFSDLPDNFPDIVIPDSAELLGSADLVHSQQVVLRVVGDGLEQRAQLMASLESMGYLLLTQMPSPPPSQTGFIAPIEIPLQMPVLYCHDVDGMLNIRIIGSTVTTASVGQANYVPFVVAQDARVSPFGNGSEWVRSRLNRTPALNSTIHLTASGGSNLPGNSNNGMSCAQMLEQHQGRGQAVGVLNFQQYMPRMELPSAARAPTSRSATFASGSRNGIESSATVNINWEMDALQAHFADQIVQQGWQLDSEVVGDITATSNWLREADGMQLLGALRLIKTGDNEFQLQFLIQNLSIQ